MSTIIKFELKELRKLANDKNSCVVEKKVTQNLALQPWCLGNLKESIKSLLDYKIGKFDKEFNGILLSYKNLRVLQNVGSIRNDNADIHFQVQADYFIFRPYVGATLKGIINKKSSTHLGILIHRVFNVVIPRPTEEPGNKWIGASFQEGQEVVFRIVVLDLYGALPYIRGEFDETWMGLTTDGDEEIIDTKSSPMNVSYINFDKTKPFHKQSSGKLSPSVGEVLQKNNTKLGNTSKHRIKNMSSTSENDTQIIDKISTAICHKNIASEISITEKNKNKKQSKILELDQKHTDNMIVKNSKKQKKGA